MTNQNLSQAKEEVLLLYSGGLDSRVAAKLLQEDSYSVLALYFKLPFEPSFIQSEEFLSKENIPLITVDCTEGNQLDAYLHYIEYPKYGRGKGYNPCIDCKLFMYKKAVEIAKSRNIKKIATGEVVGQRPMSQNRKAIHLIEEETDFPILRPLLKHGVSGRQRKQQIKLANQYGFSYPSPAGGCLLCERELKKRFEVLIKKNLIGESTLQLITLGRHYYFSELQIWCIVGRDESENDVLETYSNVILSGKGKPAVFYYPLVDDSGTEAKNMALKLQEAYSLKDWGFIKSLAAWKI